MVKAFKYIYFGTPEYSADVLLHLLENGLQPEAVVTQPDKKIGRNQLLSPSPVKSLAMGKSIPVLEIKKFDKKKEESLTAFHADVFVVFSYGRIIPQNILSLARFGALNIHPSLLPKLRGPSPVATAILQGLQETGVSIILLDEKMDHGPILAQKKVGILAHEKNLELTKRLARVGAELLIQILQDFVSGKKIPTPQNDQDATFSKILTREDGKIHWNQPNNEIYNQFRAFDPWPGIFSSWRNKRLKILDAAPIPATCNRPGEIFLSENGSIAVCCGKSALEIRRLQLEGKKETSAKDFLKGNNEILGETLTEI